ncbi:MAG: sensor histidine kinase, partial [Pseudomonadota bacterium]
MAIWGKLSGRLVALTIVFVMLSEILLFVPSVAYFRHDFLSERLERAEIASLAVLVDRSGRIQPELERQLLADAGVMAISRLRAGRRELVLSRPLSEEVVRRYRVEDTNIFRLIFDAAKCVLFARDRYILFSGPSMHSAGERIEIVVDDGDLKSEMLAYSVNIFWLSLFISIMTATLVFLAINAFLVRPMGRLIEGVISFREDPDDPERIIRPSGSKDEIGDAERELAETQREVQAALKQRTRLAALGG